MGVAQRIETFVCMDGDRLASEIAEKAGDRRIVAVAMLPANVSSQGGRLGIFVTVVSESA